MNLRMSGPGQLEQAAGPHNNTNHEDDDLTRIFDIRKERLELLIVRTINHVVGPIMGDLVRKVVKEEIESVQENLMRHIQCLGRQGSTSEPRGLRLMFMQSISSPVHTSSKIEGEGGVSLNLALVDTLTGEVVKTGPEAAAKVEILVLKGDYAGHEGCNGKSEDFNNRIVDEMEGKKSVLQGTTTLKLKEGIGSINNLSFTQNSRWMRNSKLCLGARAVNSFPGTTIEPAKTDPFDIKDNRTRSYAKNEVPSLLDKVSRLKHIGKHGKERLNDQGINTVKDLLVLLNMNPQRLREILKVGSKIWEEITDHAKKCIIDEGVYMYIDRNLQQNSGVVFDVIGQVKGLLKEFQYFPMNMLSDDEQKNAQKLVVSAFDQWEEVSRYNDESSLMEHFPHTLVESPGQFIDWDYNPSFNRCEQAGASSYGIRTSMDCIGELSQIGSPEQAGASSYGIRTSIDCIGESSQIGSPEQAGASSYGIHTSIDCIGESSQIGYPEQGLCGPIYSPPHYGEESLHFMNLDNQPERLSPELNPKLSWKSVICVICVSRWFMIKKRVGSWERDPVNKKQKIS